MISTSFLGTVTQNSFLLISYIKNVLQTSTLYALYFIVQLKVSSDVSQSCSPVSNVEFERKCSMPPATA